MNYIEKKAYGKILISVLVLLGLFYVACFYLPQEIKAISQEIIEKKQETKNLEIQISKLDIIKEKYLEMSEKRGEIEKYVVNYSDIYDLTSSIEEIATKSGVEYRSTIADNEDNVLLDNLLYIDYKMTVTGSFKQTMIFLTNLESLKYYNDIKEIEVRSNSSVGKYEIDEIDIDFVLRMYILDNR